jgi:alpha-tubulin suppressor-like RCC1 family protein
MSTPKKVQIGEKVVKVSCGGGHTAFITANNELWMCGKGRDGQLGRGDSLSNASISTPVKIADLKFDGQKVIIEDVALGNNHSVALGYINN